jgi:hypothetical protein
MNFNKDDSSTPIRFTPSREDKYSTSNNEVGTRPAGDPKSNKNFQKILRKDPDNKDKNGEEQMEITDDEEGAQSAMVIVEEEALKKKQQPTSLFELSRKTSTSKNLQGSQLGATRKNTEKTFIADSKSEGLTTQEKIPEEESVESPAMLYSKISTKDQKKLDVHMEQTPAMNMAQPAKMTEKQDKFNSQFAIEQPDLSYINPLALNTQPVQNANITVDKPIVPTINIQEIIDQLVDKVVQMETNNSTDTVITLKRPPILAGADLVVTGFDSAKGEFNITFQNLTQAAKNLLDMRVNQQSLLDALHQKGYAVHIITNTTLTEINPPTIAASTPQDKNRNQDQSGKQEQQRQSDKQK